VSPEPFFVETGHDFPADLSSQMRDSIVAAAKKALQSLGLTWGPAHVELRLTTAGPAIVEINPRLAGGYIPEIVRLATGVDMICETLKLVVGTIPDIGPITNDHASIRFITPGDEGIIRRFAGLEQAWEVEGVTDVQAYRRISEPFQIQHDFRDRIGHVITRGRSAMIAARAAESARTKIRVEIDLR
jgi:biotin carboxylase